MKSSSLRPLLSPLALFAVIIGSVHASDTAGWLTPTESGISVAAAKPGEWRIVSTRTSDFTVESAQHVATKPGDTIAVDLTLRVGLGTRALPELVCYDRAGKEIPVPSSLERWTRYFTTDWQEVRRVFPTQPGTVSVRARIRGTGRGTVGVRGFDLRPVQIDAYATGALVAPLHPFRRTGIVLESNHGLVDTSRVSHEDRDGDGRWALIMQDLDALTAPNQGGEDWRTKFEDDPNVIYWSDGAVLKSDTVTTDRVPDPARALHFRMETRPGPYTVKIGDPGRAVAVSLDGVNWKRHEGGAEIDLGARPMSDGVIELWIDACYRDRISTGPVYFDYVRLEPTLQPPSVERLFAAARQKPPQVTRGAAEERRVPLTLDGVAAEADQPWPVRCGVPIPQGEMISAQHAAVFDGSGRKVPSQARAMAVWPDGSVRWLYLDFLHAPGAGLDYVLRYGPEVRAAEVSRPLTITRSDSGVEIDTGAIRFAVSGKRFGLIENVRFASGGIAQADPIASEIVEAGGRVWRALDLPVEKIEIEQAGPLHAAIVVATRLAPSGQPASGFHHRARIHAFAGSPVVQVE
jgi:hypothetical protein